MNNKPDGHKEITELDLAYANQGNYSFPKLEDNLERVLISKIFSPYNSLNDFARQFHADARAAGWYTDIETGRAIERNQGEQMMLMVTEIAEAFEGVRKNKMDDHLPHRKSAEVELADLLIRVFDFAGYHNLDLAGAVLEKAAYNKTREDHKIENRRKADGKKV